ncbi:MAG: MATE family efflux transporter [Alphaproteobacteria bacterium]|nr:MATE family efflux transporter [Alphaproteobacteria bacterium]
MSNLSVPLLGAVDTAVMGHLPDPAYIGGVAIGGLVFSYLYWGFGFLRMGTTGFVAQAAGAKDADEIRAVLARGLLLALLFGAGIIALQLPIALGAFAVIEGSAKVEALGQSYVFIRIWGAPAALVNYVAIGWLLGMQRAGATFVLTVFVNGLNIALSLLFVVGFGWGIEGVAAATLIAEWSAAGLGLALISARLHRIGGAWRWALIRDRARLIRMVRVNLDIFIRTLCVITGFAWFTARGAIFGDTVLAANAVLMIFQSFLGHGLDGFAHAAEALVGTAIGARDRAALRAAIRVSTLWAGICAGVFTLVYVVAGGPIIAALTNIEPVRATALVYLPYVLASPLLSVWCYQLDGMFVGATRTAEMRNAMLLSLAIFIAAEQVLVPLYANHGLWLALLIFMVARAATLVIWYPRLARGLTQPQPG